MGAVGQLVLIQGSGPGIGIQEFMPTILCGIHLDGPLVAIGESQHDGYFRIFGRPESKSNSEPDFGLSAERHAVLTNQLVARLNADWW
jgi:hypothetical protein